APAGLGHARNLADDRLAVEIFQLDLDLVAPARVRHAGVAADIAFALEHLEHALALLGARHGHLGLVPQLRIADTGNHVADWIVHSHAILLTSSTSRGRGSGLSTRGRAARYGSGDACDSKRADGRSSRNGCGCGWPTNCAAARQASASLRNGLPSAASCRARSP